MKSNNLIKTDKEIAFWLEKEVKKFAFKYPIFAW